MSTTESDHELYVRARELLLNAATHIDGMLTHVDALLAAGDVDSARMALRTLYGTPSLLRRIVRQTMPAELLEPIPAPPGATPPDTGTPRLPADAIEGRRLHLVRAPGHVTIAQTRPPSQRPIVQPPRPEPR